MDADAAHIADLVFANDELHEQVAFYKATIEAMQAEMEKLKMGAERWERQYKALESRSYSQGAGLAWKPLSERPEWDSAHEFDLAMKADDLDDYRTMKQDIQAQIQADMLNGIKIIENQSLSPNEMYVMHPSQVVKLTGVSS